MPANHGYTGARGYHPLLAAGTGDVLMARLREGRAHTARGAAHFLRETVGRVRYGGARGQPNVPANSRQPSPRAPLAVSYPTTSLATATTGRHRRPQKRLQTARQPPVYPNSSPDYRACNSLAPLPLSSRRLSVDSGLG